MKVAELFQELDGTNPVKPYTQDEIKAAMSELHRRVHKQAEYYGGKVNHKTGNIDRSKHKFYDAQIAPDE